MTQDEKRSFWDRLFGRNQPSSAREERVVEYIIHRLGEGAHLGDVVREEYVRRNASPPGDRGDLCRSQAHRSRAPALEAGLRIGGTRSWKASTIAARADETGSLSSLYNLDSQAPKMEAGCRSTNTSVRTVTSLM
jgi:hypothetical protein